MSDPEFMSQQHVDVMNALLVDSEQVQQACTALGVPRVLSYDLADGPDGATVHWTMTLDRTVQFSLDRPGDPDVVFTGDWARMIRSCAGGRDGQSTDPGLELVGDMELVAQVGAVLDVARAVAAVPVTFPSLTTAS